MGRLAISAKDLYELTLQLYETNNLEIARNRVGVNGNFYYIKKIMATYPEVSVQFYD